MFSKRWILVAAGVVLLAVTGTRGDPGATQTLHLAMDVFDGAGGCMQSAELRHFFTLSEPAVGRSTNDKFRLWSGFVPPRRGCTDVADETAPPSYDTELLPASPNPFNPRTTIHYAIASPTDVNLAIYDIQGRVVRVLHQGRFEPGRYEVSWDGRNDDGVQVSTGVYFCELRAGRERETQRLVLAK